MLDAALLRTAFEVPVTATLRAPSSTGARGHAGELRHVARAVPKRRAEFLTVRDCARVALAELGGPVGELVPNPDRSPRWPAGFVGSLSHSSELCAAVVARTRDAASLGLDLELDGPLDEALHATVCTRAERRRLEALPRVRAGLVAKRLFSAKEAFYKCQYPLTGTFLTCAQVELALDVAAGTFVVVEVDLPPELERIAREARGRCMTADDHVVATAWSNAASVPLDDPSAA